MTWYEFLFLDPPRQPRPLVVPETPPIASAISPADPPPVPRDRDDGLPYMTIDAP